MEETLKGRRVILVARCSTDPQKEASIPKQLELGRYFAARNKMTVVDEKKLEGMSATLREHVPDLKKLLNRKIIENDYDCLYFMTLSRFDRQRAEGVELFRAFTKEGVLIVTEKEGTFTGKYGWIKLGIALQESQSYVEDLAVHSATGTMRKIKEGKLPHCGTAYGLDRLYIDAAGTPQFIIRRVSKTLLQRINPNTGQAITEMTIDPLNNRRSSMLPGGRIRLVPGDPAHWEVVVRIFHERYVEGKGPSQISLGLNDEGVPAPEGGLWGNSTVAGIFNNSVYTGIGYANVRTQARFCTRGTHGPIIYEEPRQPRRRIDDPSLMCKQIPPTYRPIDEQLEVAYPELDDFLPDDLRQLALAAQKKRRVHKDRSRKKNIADREAGGNRHAGSKYILSGLIRSVQGNYSMTGGTTGSRANGRKRKYRHYKAEKPQHFPKSDAPPQRCVKAEPLESAVLDAVSSIISDRLEMESMIRSEVVSAFHEAQNGRTHLDELRSDKEKAEQEYKLITTSFGPRGIELTKARAAQLERRLDEIDHQLSVIGHSEIVTPEQIEETVKRVSQQTRNLYEFVKSEQADTVAIRRVLSSLVQKLEFDFETREAHLEVGIPSWAIAGREGMDAYARLVDTPHTPFGHEASHGKPIIFATFQCPYVKKGRTPCMECHRLPKHQPSLAAAA